MRLCHSVSIALVLAVSGCQSSSPVVPGPVEPPPPGEVAVVFRYLSPAVPGAPPSDPVGVTGCVHHGAPLAGAGPALLGSWSDRTYRSSASSGEGVLIAAPDVPIAVEHVVYVVDLAMCYVTTPASYVSYRRIFANGVELTRIVRHASGMEGVAFRVGRDGTVIP